MDLVSRVARMPRPGETVAGDRLMTVPGGKGANQAVAAAKLSNGNVAVHMVGRVGEDDFGDRLINNMSRHGVNIENVVVTEGAATGTAMIFVDEFGENSIIVNAGANAAMQPHDVDAAAELIRGASVVLLQLEIPLDTVHRAIRLCVEHDVFTILDPTPVPADGLPREFYGVHLLSPNQHEAEMLLGLDDRPSVKRKVVPDAKQIAADLLARGPRSVVLKLGANGCLSAMVEDGLEVGEPYKVVVQDTTAAGDAFTAALAVAQAEQMPRVAALHFANAAGAIACSTFGAQPSLPAREAVDQLLKRSMHA